MLLVIIALLPAYVVSVLAFGWGALITTAISVAACVLFDQNSISIFVFFFLLSFASLPPAFFRTLFGQLWW